VAPKKKNNVFQGISVFATSNAIMQLGWLNLSRDSARKLGFEYTNHSIGGSSSCYGAYCAEQNTGSQIEVYDFLLNDQNLIDIGALTAKQSLGQHIALIRSLIERGAADRSVVILSVLKSAYVSRAHDALGIRVRDILTAASIKYIDVSDKLSLWLDENNDVIDQAYADDRHFSPKYQQLIGELVLETIQARPTHTGPNAGREALLRLTPSRYRKLALESKGYAQSDVSTSLMKSAVIDIPEGKTFDVRGAKYLAGCLFWHHDNNGALIVQAAKKRRVLLRRGFKSIFLFDTYATPIQIDGQVQIKTENDKKVPYQRALGLPSSIYDTSDVVSRLGYFVGCDMCPEALVDQWAR